jgi:hypothetical protein
VRRLDLTVDNGAFPVWGWGRWPARRGRAPHEGTGNVTPQLLGISAGLTADLQAWADWHDARTGEWRPPDAPALPATDEEWQRWRDDGHALAERLERESGAAVVYPARGWDPACETCWPRS